MAKESQSNFNRRAIEAFQEIKSLILSNSVLTDAITDIGLLGSINDGEGVPSWSDLDILVMLESDEIGNFDQNLIHELRQTHNTVASKFPDFEISLLPHTMYDFEKYVAYEYLKNYQFATIYYSICNESFRDRIEKILNNRRVSLEIQKRYAIYRLRHIRFNLIRAVASWNKSDKSAAKLVLDRLIQTGIYITGFHGKYAQGKKDRLEMIRDLVDNQDVISIYDWATNMRLRWPAITEEESNEIVKKGIDALYAIERFMMTKYPEEVPEEYMNKTG